MTQDCIVIINANFADRMHMGGSLEEGGFWVDEACDGKEASSCVLENYPDLIILNAQTDKEDGVRLCRELRKQHSLPSILQMRLTA